MKKELFIFLMIFIGVVGSIKILTHLKYNNESLDFQIHDTYFVFDRSQLIFFLSFTLLYLIYFIRESFSLFQNLNGNIILLMINVICVIFLSFLLMVFSLDGATIYPPLDANDYSPSDVVQKIKFLLFILQIINIAFLIFLCIRVGRLSI
jgi:hypothetical protein